MASDYRMDYRLRYGLALLVAIGLALFMGGWVL
jgi:hypothetical protein